MYSRKRKIYRAAAGDSTHTPLPEGQEQRVEKNMQHICK
jgi:hypothetical protein